MPHSRRAAAAGPEALRGEIEGFLATCRRPAVIEAGSQPIVPEQDAFVLKESARVLRLETWDNERSLSRKLVRISKRREGCLTLTGERFGGKSVTIQVVDLDDPRNQFALRTVQREVLNEQLGLWLSRQFAGWRIEELTTGADLEHSLSPTFPRAVISRGRTRWAAMASPRDPEKADQALTFGLIWLDYLRRRDARRLVEGLALFLPKGCATNTLLRLQALDPGAAVFGVYQYDENGMEEPLDTADRGNLINDLELWKRSHRDAESRASRWTRQLECLDGVEAVELGRGVRSLRVRGYEFARLEPHGLVAGIHRKKPVHGLADIEKLAGELVRQRSVDAPGRKNALRLCQPERWLESVVRRDIRVLQADLELSPIYGQVVASAGCDRGLVDLLAIDAGGRLTAIELKASEDPHLPMQALDYWVRLRWHAERGEFPSRGYFAGRTVLRTTPRLLLVAPALRFHSTTDALLSFYSPEIEVERIGLDVEWQRKARVVLRLGGARSRSLS